MDEVAAKLEAIENSICDIPRVEPSYLLKSISLHEYQIYGVKWLMLKYKQRLNPILGDEMGLGKTLQVIAFINCLQHQNEKIKDFSRKFLVIAPLSVLTNWTDQISRFAPNLQAVMSTGSKTERAETLHYFKQSSDQVRDLNFLRCV
jgi:SNF2 family DNA or RNA helicase